MLTLNPGLITTTCNGLLTAQAGKDYSAITSHLGILTGQVRLLDQALPAEQALFPALQVLSGGPSRDLTKSHVESLTRPLLRKVDLYLSVEGNRKARQAVATTPADILDIPGILTPTDRTFDRRQNQHYIAGKIARHFTTPESPSQRAVFRMDTGDGKSITYCFSIEELRKTDPAFRDAVVVLLSHQKEPALSLAQTAADYLREDRVAFLGEEGVTHSRQLIDNNVTVAGLTYSKMAQEGTVALLKEWAGARKIIFVLDECDMVVHKGHRDPDADAEEEGIIAELSDEERRGKDWAQFLLDFDLFRMEEGERWDLEKEEMIEGPFFTYNPNTPHFMIGASATLDRPDGIHLSTIWGPLTNLVYHVPMAQAMAQGRLVPILAKLREVRYPEGEKKNLLAFVDIRSDGTLEVNGTKIRDMASTDHAVLTSVRAYLDEAIMELEGKKKTIRNGIGFAVKRAGTLEKHLRWQQDLFALVEKIYQVSLLQEDSFSRNKVVAVLGGLDSLDDFKTELQRFLYSDEWKAFQPLIHQAISNLKRRPMEGVRSLFENLYKIFNVEVRKIRGRPLVAAAVWNKMDLPVDREEDPSNETGFRNRFGDRETTMAAIRAGEIDMCWSIKMLDRGFDAPVISLEVDNAPTDSRREEVQRIGRGTRPSDPAHPADRSRKPNMVYITVTPNLDAHTIDLSRWDVAKIFGQTFDPHSPILNLTGEVVDNDIWKTPDPVQLDRLGDDKLVNIVVIGRRTARKLAELFREIWGDLADDPELIASDLETSFGIQADGQWIERLLSGRAFPKEKQLIRLLDVLDVEANRRAVILQTYYSERSVYDAIYHGVTRWRMERDSAA